MISARLRLQLDFVAIVSYGIEVGSLTRARSLLDKLGDHTYYTPPVGWRKGRLETPFSPFPPLSHLLAFAQGTNPRHNPKHTQKARA